jgi:endonuclease/exonuclease/phosphatase family metal-dependent hydrolase
LVWRSYRAALAELREIENQRALDIILLQEMDETGAEQIARELRLNYVYFPAAIEPTYDENFGNAILSESVFTLPKFRKEQYTSILQDIDPEAEFVIVGGDFNSFTQEAVDEITSLTYFSAPQIL